MSSESKRNLTVEQACEWLNIPRSTFYGLMKNGQAPKGFKLGKRRLFPLTELEAWMSEFEQVKA